MKKSTAQNGLYSTVVIAVGVNVPRKIAGFAKQGLFLHRRQMSLKVELPDWQKTGFAFVATPVDIAGALPVQLTPHHEFARASEEEVRQIQDFLDKTPVAAEYPGAARQLYEQRPVIQPNSATSRTVRYEPLEPAA